jgi:hypothetical protein
MVGNLKHDISDDQLENIQGKVSEIDTDKYSKFYNPIYTSFDMNYHKNLNLPKSNEISPYSSILIGSSL